MSGIKLLEKIKGFSLAEVVISLGVVSTTMIVAISMTSQSLRLAKENELQNTANEILVQSLELSKSPAPVNIVPVTGSLQDLTGSYKLVTSSSGETVLDGVDIFIDMLTVEDCSPDSSDYEKYKVEIEGLNALVCNQIILEREDAIGGNPAYKITTIVVYEIGAEKVLEKIESFRDGSDKDFTLSGNAK